MFGDKVKMAYVENTQEIGRDADVILAATNSTEILLRCDGIEKGTTVIALDGFIDVDPQLSFYADKWFVGNEKTDIEEIVDSGEMSYGLKLDPENITGGVVLGV